MPEPVLMDDAENQIKKIYIEEVNHLISYYEIYSHDIPADIVEEIVMVFHSLPIMTKMTKRTKCINLFFLNVR